MTDKEFKRLSRSELIDIIYELQKQNEEKDAQVEKLQKDLEDRELKISNAGSIAEAALQVNGVFEAAQAAADQYLSALRESDQECKRRLEEAEQEKRRIVREAELQAQMTIREAKTESERVIGEAEIKAKASWDIFEKKANELISAHAELQSLMGRGKTE